MEAKELLETEDFKNMKISKEEKLVTEELMSVASDLFDEQMNKYLDIALAKIMNGDENVSEKTAKIQILQSGKEDLLAALLCMFKRLNLIDEYKECMRLRGSDGMAGTKTKGITREEKMSLVQEKMQNGISEIFKSEKYKEYIDTMARFPRYSINNCILIASQRPEANLVCGYKKWKNDFNRVVNKGEREL